MIDKLYRVFQKNGINIAKDDFVYGLTNLIHWLTFIMILIPIGLTLNILIESCLFYIFYSQLRKYTGGIHMEIKYTLYYFIANYFCYNSYHC